MGGDQKAKITHLINRHDWYHVRPSSAPASYTQRGRFYAATYPKAAEYGKPYLEPDHVCVTNPLIGDDEETDTALFGRSLGPSKNYRGVCRQESVRKRKAQQLGYDAILVLPEGSTQKFLSKRRIPATAELCLLDLRRSSGPAAEWRPA